MVTAKEFTGIAEEMASALERLAEIARQNRMKTNIRILQDGYLSANCYGFAGGEEEGFTVYGYGLRTDGSCILMDDVSGRQDDYYWIPLQTLKGGNRQ